MFSVNKNTVQDLIVLTDLLQMRDIKDHCCQFMEINLDSSNCLGIYYLVDIINIFMYRTYQTQTWKVIRYIIRNYVSARRCGGERGFVACLSVHLFVCLAESLSACLVWNDWTKFYKTWYVARTIYVVVHITRKLWSPNFCRSYAHLNSQLCQKSL